MKNVVKKLFIIAIVVVMVLSICFNIYQGSKVNRFKDDLSYIVRQNIQGFASKLGNLNDEEVYTLEYGYITSAQNAYATLCQGKGIPIDEYSESLGALLLEIKLAMIDNREAFIEVFDNRDIAELLLKVSLNLEDKESINKVFELLKFIISN